MSGPERVPVRLLGSAMLYMVPKTKNASTKSEGHNVIRADRNVRTHTDVSFALVCRYTCGTATGRRESRLSFIAMATATDIAP